MRVRAVIDTNVVISAVINPAGTPAAVVRAAGEAFQLVWSAGIVAECLRVVDDRRVTRRVQAAGSGVDARAAIARLVALAEMVPPARLPSIRVVAEDHSDDLFLATALAGGAGVLVSGDRKHLLPLKEFAGIRIVDAATFAQELGLPGHPRRPGAVHEPVAPWGDGELELALEAKRWARARRRRAGDAKTRGRRGDPPLPGPRRGEAG